MIVGGITALAITIGSVGAALAHDAYSTENTAATQTSHAKREPVVGPAHFHPGFRHGLVRTDGGRLHYVKGGSGPVLVLLHGWPETWWDWHLVMPELAKTHTVIAFDLPGLGNSSIPRDGYDQKTTAARLHQAVNRLGYREVKVMGHDMGVLIGYAWARDYPQEVTRLAVLDSTLLGFGLEDAYSLSFHFRLNMAPSPIPEQIVDNDDVAAYLNHVFEFAAIPDAIDRDYYIHAYRDPARRSAGYNYYRAWPANAEDTKAHAVSKRLTQPVLAMGAEYVFGLGVAASFEQVAGDVRGIVAPGSGHWIQEETPQFVIDCANLFFGPAGVPAPSESLANCVA
ncbi:alpha/beta fold hydrolase [Solwaraspora sp. WMMB335]|uniref:alpha/beta fold hydrolase n=1 Tax=Solwaraspora sp. WMMB335 TaxID=3404118 RepID=UPI003B93DF2E